MCPACVVHCVYVCVCVRVCVHCVCACACVCVCVCMSISSLNIQKSSTGLIYTDVNRSLAGSSSSSLHKCREGV